MVAAAQKSIGSSHSHSHSAHPFVPQSFFCRPAEVVARELTACLLVKRHEGGEPLWGVIVETEAYSQDEPATRGYHRRSPINETLFGKPGHFYVYLSYGIHHYVKRVEPKRDGAHQLSSPS